MAKFGLIDLIRSGETDGAADEGRWLTGHVIMCLAITVVASVLVSVGWFLSILGNSPRNPKYFSILVLCANFSISAYFAWAIHQRAYDKSKFGNTVTNATQRFGHKIVLLAGSWMFLYVFEVARNISLNSLVTRVSFVLVDGCNVVGIFLLVYIWIELAEITVGNKSDRSLQLRRGVDILIMIAFVAYVALWCVVLVGYQKGDNGFCRFTLPIGKHDPPADCELVNARGPGEGPELLWWIRVSGGMVSAVALAAVAARLDSKFLGISGGITSMLSVYSIIQILYPLALPSTRRYLSEVIWVAALLGKYTFLSVSLWMLKSESFARYCWEMRRAFGLPVEFECVPQFGVRIKSGRVIRKSTPANNVVQLRVMIWNLDYRNWEVVHSTAVWKNVDGGAPISRKAPKMLLPSRPNISEWDVRLRKGSGRATAGVAYFEELVEVTLEMEGEDYPKGCSFEFFLRYAIEVGDGGGLTVNAGNSFVLGTARLLPKSPTP